MLMKNWNIQVLSSSNYYQNIRQVSTRWQQKLTANEFHIDELKIISYKIYIYTMYTIKYQIWKILIRYMFRRLTKNINCVFIYIITWKKTTETNGKWISYWWIKNNFIQKYIYIYIYTMYTIKYQIWKILIRYMFRRLTRNIYILKKHKNTRWVKTAYIP